MEIFSADHESLSRGFWDLTSLNDILLFEAPDGVVQPTVRVMIDEYVSVGFMDP